MCPCKSCALSILLLGKGALASPSSHSCPTLAEVDESKGISVDIGPGLGNHEGFILDNGTFKRCDHFWDNQRLLCNVPYL